MAEQTPEATPVADDSMGISNLENVRAILFGDQIRDIEQKLSSLETRLFRAITELQEDGRRRDDAIETFVKREFTALGKRASADSAERAEGAQALNQEFQKAVGALEKRLAQLAEIQSQADRELREQLLAQTKDLLEQQRRWRSELASALSSGIDGLRSQETDRATLASLLSEMASKLLAGAPTPPTTH